MKHWTVESLPWDQFDQTKVNPDLLAYAKAASLVEANAYTYVEYLLEIFAGDSSIQEDIRQWGDEEMQHGRTLRAWAEKADPTFDYDKAMKTFRDAFVFPDAPLRGSKANELVSRCVIETGTSSFYTALRDVADEPVFKEICRRIAGDEIRHYHLFYAHLEKRYAATTTRFQRLKMILSRSMEVTDEELCFAFAAANYGKVVKDDLPQYAKSYLNFMAHVFEARHLKTAMSMMARAAGLPIKNGFASFLAHSFHGAVRLRLMLTAAVN